MTRNREIILIAGITCLGALLRLLQLGSQSLWLDELYSVLAARREWMQVLTASAQGDTNPPLYNLLLYLSLQFGTDEIAARLPSWIFSVASIPVAYLLARRLFDYRTALIAALGLAISPFHLLFAQEARMYALLGFLSLTAALLFHRAWTEEKWQAWVLFVVVQALALYTHSLAFLNLLALDGFALVDKSRWVHRRRPLLLTHVALFLIFLPWLAILLQQAARVQSGFWAAAPSPLVLLTTPYLLILGDVVPPVLVPFALFAVLSLLVFAFLAAARAISSRQPANWGLVFSLVTLFVPLLVLYLVSLYRSIFVERTLLPASFGLLLFLAWAVAHARPRALNIALGLVVSIGMVAGLANYFANPAVQKPRMRDAAQALLARVEPGDEVLHTSDSSALGFRYYAPGLENRFLRGDPDYALVSTRGRTGQVSGLVPEDYAVAVRDSSRVWLVVALDHNIEYQKTRVAEFDTLLERKSSENIGGIWLYLYEVRH